LEALDALRKPEVKEEKAEVKEEAKAEVKDEPMPEVKEEMRYRMIQNDSEMTETLNSTRVTHCAFERRHLCCAAPGIPGCLFALQCLILVSQCIAVRLGVVCGISTGSEGGARRARGAVPTG
jgi:hypothetical protein